MTFTSPNHTNNHSDVDQTDTLRSTRVKQRLNQVDKIRAKGIGDHIALPQLVVCGAQSAGKSSVLEGITGIPFPRQDGVCTKFATEIILRHSQKETSITASIIPHMDRDEAEAGELRSFQHCLAGYEELPDVIKNAASRMGIQGLDDSEDDSPAFAADVLSIEVIGDIGLHLTVVDLPGSISVDENEGEDVKLVSDLVDSYLQSSRTIILAVVQATNDLVIEPIIQRARHFDKSGERTVGIITKPDLINENTEGRITPFTNNSDKTKLKLGFFLLKNPSPQQLADGISPSERKRQEMDFFQSRQWREHGINLSRVGIDALRFFLQQLLEEHIEKELPKVCKEIGILLQRTQTELNDLGEQRSTIDDQRLFLSKLSMDFLGIMQAALEGAYQSPMSDFFTNREDGSPNARLRARIHELNSLFAAYMRQRSQKRKTGVDLHRHVDELVNLQIDEDLCDGKDSNDKCDRLEYLERPLFLKQWEFDVWVKQIYKNTRGQELPGNYNNAFLTELFHEQSSRWPDIAKSHVNHVHTEASAFIEMALKHVIKEKDVRIALHKRINCRLQENLDAALNELHKICDDERIQPITYNHYYTDNIQKARQDATKTAIEQALQGASADWDGVLHVSNTGQDRARLLSSLKEHVTVDMNQQACEEAKAGLDAYYKVAMKTFVDNVCRQVIERHIMCKLRDVFTPTGVLKFLNHEVELIASETSSKQEKRKELRMLESALQESLLELSA